jgi:hypothetical protein
MRTGLIGLAAGLLLLACGSSGPAPGSPEWCQTTPVEKQAEDPTAMMACAETP